MRSGDARPLWLRALRFERCEDRIVLSGRPAADFWLDNSFLHQPGDAFEQVEIGTTLNGVHDDFGVTYARDELGFVGHGQTVAVIDSGIAYDHLALGGGLGSQYRVVGGRDFTEEKDADPYDDAPAGFHGTHVAGIVGSDDSLYSGVAPGVDLVALRVFNDRGVGYYEWVEQALDWVHVHRDDFANPITTVTLSLGAAWNANSIPSWAMLEDELDTLERDGIFVAVAAGNNFLSYDEAGVSYPAASPYVVPVASVDLDGKISDYSQRNARVLAAPGEQITSTVPDYLYSFDGVANDFAAASGTSMAAPYVAGASVLLREALEFTGRTNVTQDMIYGWLRRTGDAVYDPDTESSYRRINIEAALDAIMPADDYGSAPASARGLGTVSNDVVRTGTIGSLNDRDYFRFTAGASGVVTFTVNATWDLAPDLELVGGGGTVGDSTLSFEVVAGQQYVVGLGTAEGIGRYEIRGRISSQVIDLGEVEIVEFTAPAGGRQYRFSAGRDGLVTVEAQFAPGTQNATVGLYDHRGRLVARGDSSGSDVQLSFSASAGARYTLAVTGDYGPAEFRLTNVFDELGASVNTTVGDFNSDGLTDVVGRDDSGDWWLARGTESGFVTEYAGHFSTDASWSRVLIDDFTGDGQRDVLACAAGGNWWVAIGSGAGFVTKYAGKWSCQTEWHDVLLGDFAGDSRMDVLARSTPGTWWLAVRIADGYQTRQWGRWSPNAGWTDVMAGDFSGDGLLDVVGRTSKGTWWVAENTESRLVSRRWAAWSSGIQWTDVAAADFTGDGALDIVGRTDSGGWYVAENLGNQFTSRRWGAWSTGTEWSDVTVSDFNGDGLADVLGRSAAGTWWVAQNTGSRFVNQKWGAWSSNTVWGSVATGDVTGDGLADVVGRTAAGNWYVAENTGSRFVSRLWEAWDRPSFGAVPQGGDWSAGGSIPLTTAAEALSRWPATTPLLQPTDAKLGDLSSPKWSEASEQFFAAMAS